VQTLVRERERLHPPPIAARDQQRFHAAAAALVRRLPRLTREQAVTELVRLAALPGLGGREGHTGIFPWIPGSPTHAYPLRFWQFPEGLVVTAARPPYAGLVGSRLVSVQGRPIDEVLALVSPLVPRDNESSLSAYRPLFLMVSELLTGLGVLDHVGPVQLEVADPNGRRRVVTVDPIGADEQSAWLGGEPLRLPPDRRQLWLSQPDSTLWWRFLPRSGTLYLQFNAVRGGIDRTAEQVRQRAAGRDVRSVVVDLRQNGGGDNTTYDPLLAALQDPAVDRAHRLFVLVGRVTFSAAANFATRLESTTSAVFVGEPMGGSPNLYGDATRVALPGSGLALYVATRYWQLSTPDDPRTTIDPDLAAPLSWLDYRLRRDPCLERIIALS
jgi:hypothetical protein